MKLIKIFAFLLSLSIATFILTLSLVSHAQDKRNRDYREMVEASEDSYEREVRNTLNELGFKNAGINLTKSYDENKDISYRILINHHSFEYATPEKMAYLEDSLCELAENCNQNTNNT